MSKDQTDYLGHYIYREIVPTLLGFRWKVQIKKVEHGSRLTFTSIEHTAKGHTLMKNKAWDAAIRAESYAETIMDNRGWTYLGGFSPKPYFDQHRPLSAQIAERAAHAQH